MSALAAILYSRGNTVSGSDMTANDQTRMLEAMGITVYIGHRRRNVPECDLVVINNAIDDNNPELVAAKKRGIKIKLRDELLADIEKQFPIRIAVAGTHGKSTTTAMIYQILKTARKSPTVHNGAVMNSCGRNFVLGGKRIFLTEACEFKRSLLKLSPTIAVITNIDADHLDCYKDIDDIRQTFEKFAAKAEKVVRTHECPDIDFSLCIPGKHNIENAKAAAEVGRLLGINDKTIRKALAEFSGIERRFQKIRKLGACEIIADYAHHPTEIKAALQTAKSVYRRFLVVFQPHTYSRTIALFNDFVYALEGIPCALFRTYAAREKPIAGGSARDLASFIGCRYIGSARALSKYISIQSAKFDAIILTGAGDMLYLLW